MTTAPGGFITYGIMIAIVNKLTKGRAIKKKNFGCAGCPSSAVCGRGTCEEREVAEA